jgi:hypothetical protein
MLTKLARVATKIVGVSRDYAGFCCVTGVGAGRQWLTEPAIEPNSGSGISRSAQFRALSSAAIRGAAKYDPAFDIPYNGTPRIDRQASALGATDGATGRRRAGRLLEDQDIVAVLPECDGGRQSRKAASHDPTLITEYDVL